MNAVKSANAANSMKTFRVKRQAGPQAEPVWAEYQLEVKPRMCILDALEALNVQIMVKKLPGGPIMYTQSCKVRKCGACGMVINGKPGLACGTFVDELEGDVITLEPFAKFPIVQDLTVDRSLVQNTLISLEVWQHEEVCGLAHDKKNADLRFSSASCLHCGCCLEACPNFVPASVFGGPMGIANAFRIESSIESKKIRKEYRSLCKERLTEPCSHALTCAEVCPIKLPVTDLLAHLNR